MSTTKLRPAILVVSDTAAKEPSTDKSGPALKETFALDGGGRWEEPVIEIVADDVLAIQRVVTGWADVGPEGSVNLIVTTGGTGFASRDYTPEVGRVG